MSVNHFESRLKRSTHANKGTCISTRYIDEVFLYQVSQLEDLNNHGSVLAYQAKLQTDDEANISVPSSSIWTES